MANGASRINRGVHVFNPQPIGDIATIAATGLGRSGTTMVSRVLSELGLFMGDVLKPMSHEDRAFQTIVKAGDITAFESLCRERDAVRRKWGFKSPGLATRMNEFGERMTNPRFIVTFRDILAITSRNQMAIGTEMLNGLTKAASSYSKLVAQISATPHPVLAISYEKAIQYPDETVEDIREFCGLSGPIEAAAKVIKNGHAAYLGADAA